MEAHEIKAVRTEVHAMIYQSGFDNFSVSDGHRSINKGKRFSTGLETTIGKLLEKVSTLHQQKQKLDKVIEQAEDAMMAFNARQYDERRRLADIAIADEKLRIRIFSRDGWICLKCSTKDNLTIDHIVPVKRGGGNEDENLQSLCGSCNSSKGIKNE